MASNNDEIILINKSLDTEARIADLAKEVNKNEVGIKLDSRGSK